MIANILFVVVVFLFSILMSVLGGLEFFLGGALPHLALLTILFVAAYRSGAIAIILAFLAGLVFDLNSSLPLGFHPLVFSIPAYIQGKLGTIILTDRIFGPIAVASIGLLCFNLIAFLIDAIISLAVSNQIFSLNNLLEIIYTIIFAPILNWVVKFIDSRFDKITGGVVKK